MQNALTMKSQRSLDRAPVVQPCLYPLSEIISDNEQKTLKVREAVKT